MPLEIMQERFKSEEQQINIKKAITYLNRHQFFHSDSSANNAVLKALQNPLSRLFISDIFNLMGYQFISNDVYGYYGIIPSDDIAESRTLTEIETFVLLGLKLVYDKLFDRGDFDEKSNVETSINEFCDELSGYAKEAGWEIFPPEIRKALDRLKGNQIISMESKLNDNDDISIKIRPFIRDVISINALGKVELFLSKKTGTKEIETIEIQEELPELPETIIEEQKEETNEAY